MRPRRRAARPAPARAPRALVLALAQGQGLGPALGLGPAPSAAASAQELPALYRVAGVEDGDRLNVRDRPGLEGAVIGALAPDAGAVEVTALSRGRDWGRVSVNGRSGWAAMRFLAPVPGTAWSAPGAALTCRVTEPFWTVTLPPGRESLRLVAYGRGRRALAVTARGPALARPALGFFLDGGEGLAEVRREECSDGMSDRAYGLALSLWLSSGESVAGYQGCCTLAD